jgi:hypothetical protein
MLEGHPFGALVIEIEARPSVGGRPFTVRRSFVDDVNGRARQQRIARRIFRRPCAPSHS